MWGRELFVRQIRSRRRAKASLPIHPGRCHSRRRHLRRQEQEGTKELQKRSTGRDFPKANKFWGWRWRKWVFPSVPCPANRTIWDRKPKCPGPGGSLEYQPVFSRRERRRGRKNFQRIFIPQTSRAVKQMSKFPAPINPLRNPNPVATG